MNDHPDQGGSLADEKLDRALRAIHANAVANISAGTRAQLRQRLRSATRPSPSRRHGWQVASALVALVLVAGAYWRTTLRTHTPPPEPVAATASDSGNLVAVIDETPDLYLWLDSDEATRLASE